MSDVNAVAFVDENETFVSCSGDKTVKLWRRQGNDSWAECDVLSPLGRHVYGVTCATFCSKTGYLATAALDGKITVWETKVIFPTFLF